MNEKNVPFIQFEAIQARNERTVKRLIYAVIGSLVLLAGTNMMWMLLWLL